jgi:hypothetical protein
MVCHMLKRGGGKDSDLWQEARAVDVALQELEYLQRRAASVLWCWARQEGQRVQDVYCVFSDKRADCLAGKTGCQ